MPAVQDEHEETVQLDVLITDLECQPSHIENIILPPNRLEGDRVDELIKSKSQTDNNVL
jgi:hypothetical protein